MIDVHIAIFTIDHKKASFSKLGPKMAASRRRCLAEDSDNICMESNKNGIEYANKAI